MIKPWAVITEFQPSLLDPYINLLIDFAVRGISRSVAHLKKNQERGLVRLKGMKHHRILNFVNHPKK